MRGQPWSRRTVDQVLTHGGGRCQRLRDRAAHRRPARHRAELAWRWRSTDGQTRRFRSMRRVRSGPQHRGPRSSGVLVPSRSIPRRRLPVGGRRARERATSGSRAMPSTPGSSRSAPAQSRRFAAAVRTFDMNARSVSPDSPRTGARGPVSSRSMGPEGSITAVLSLRRGSSRSWRHIPNRSSAALIDSDGWRGNNRVHVKGASTYEYPRYQFSNRSQDIKDIFSRARATCSGSSGARGDGTTSRLPAETALR